MIQGVKNVLEDGQKRFGQKTQPPYTRLVQ